MASHRFRILKPYELLTSQGLDVTIKKIPDLDADVNVFHKHQHPHQVIEWMSKLTKKKVFDVCDDHFDRELGSYYKKACSLADVITCTNERMEKRLKKLFPKKPIYVAYDPINTLKGAPKWSSDNPKLIWFGHSTNVPDAFPWLTEAASLKYDLTLVSDAPLLGNGTDFKYIPFRAGWVEENLRKYDVVLLPTGDSPWINMKSSNRFVDALNAGCTVITNNDILYEDVVDFGIYETGSVSKALEKYRSNESIVAAINKGQSFIEKKYGDSSLKKQWMKAISDNDDSRK